MSRKVDPVNASPVSRAAWRRLVVLTVFAGLTAGVSISVLRMQPFGFVVNDGRLDRVMDFASHRAFACAAWSGDTADLQSGSVYTLEAHLRATEQWSGLPARIALPFGYSPTMLWILAPFCLLTERTAFAAWTLAGVLATVLASVRGNVHWRALLALATPLTVYAGALGQTAILSTAGLLVLIANDRDSRPSDICWGSAAVLWLLTAKPPLALTAGTALIARGRWRTVAVAMLLTIASTVALQPWLGHAWMQDYGLLLAGYDRLHLPASFAWSIVPESMSNLRAMLHPDLGLPDDIANRVSSAVWATALGAIILSARRRSLDWSIAWNLSTLSYLLFCPHVSATEDLALCVVLATLDVRGLPKAAAAGAATLVIVGLVLSPAIGPLHNTRPSVLFFVKLGLVGISLAAIDSLQEQQTIPRQRKRP